MNKANAKKILELIGEMTIRELDDRGALGAFLELYDIVHPIEESIILMNAAKHTGNRVQGIKTIRAITGMGLKESIDLSNSAEVVGDDIIIKIPGLTRDKAIERAEKYAIQYQVHDLCQIA